MFNLPPTNEPQLAPPGAGLPLIELQVARLLFRWVNSRATRESSTQLLSRECALILALVKNCDETTGSQRILVKRLPGMEDSSRFWSVYMTLDHLRIVNLAVADTIHSLGQGNIPPVAANTANVKPDPAATVAVVRDFEMSCRLIERQARPLPNLKTEKRYNHPWFGALDAASWYFLAGYHMELHRRQIELITRHLDEVSVPKKDNFKPQLNGGLVSPQPITRT